MLEHYYEIWVSAFTASNINIEVAKEEFQTWAEGLDGEMDNEYTQNDLSVMMAAKEAISELNSY
tara:strand:+ start:815 stop:1006 length:192 start_codon:yes stop_codon:yes gene_type:complete